MKTIKFHIILLFSSLIWNFSLAQNYINYTEKDGLASNFVYRMRQDHEGFMWFLTDKGMSKFDGKTFKNFTVKDDLPVNNIWNMRITPDDRIWYLTRSDVLGYIENDSVYAFKSSNKAMMNPNGRIFQSGNDISFVDGPYSYRFSDSIWQSSKILKRKIQLLNRDIFIVSDTTFRDERLEDKQGRLLLILKKNPIFRNYYQFNDSLLVKAHDSYFEIINLNSFMATYEDISHLEKNDTPNILNWFNLANDKLQLTGDKWIITFDDKLDIKEIYTIPSELNSTHNFQDKDGFIWTATSEMGVFKLPLEFNNITSFFEGKLIHKIVAIDDVVYLGVAGDGIYTLENNNPRLVLKEKLRLYDLTKFDNSTYYNFRFYLIIEKDGKFKRIENSITNFGKTLLPYQGSFFAEGYSGIWMFNRNIEFKKNHQDYPYYQGLFKQNDSLFSFSYKNMLLYDEKKDAFSEFKDLQIHKKLLTSTTIHNQTYIGTEGDGLYLFEDGKLTKLFTNDTAIINNISVADENSIWAVSEGALLHYFKNESNTFSVKKYNQINGFPTDNLTEVLFKNNRLYLGSTTGLTIINKEDVIVTSNFTPYIKSVSVNGKKMSKDSLELKYKADLNLNVNFGSINFFDANNTTFQYRLEPIQKNWTTTQSGEVNLYDLQPNEYKLWLKVDHNETQKFITIPITILPKWWQTDLVIVVYSLTIISILLLLLHLMLNYFQGKVLRERKLAQLELRALRSQMNPHFVHNSLNAIQYYIQRHEVELSEDYLAKFSKLIRLFFDYSRKRNITLKEEGGLLEKYLQVEKLRFEDKLEYDINIDDAIDVEEQLIPSMILQPIVENAVNHGLFHKNEKGKVIINFTYIDPLAFKVVIQDDGIGINKAKEIYKASSRNYQTRSSAVLQERLELLSQSKNWNVTYSIEDRSIMEDATGTVVILTFNQYQDS